MKNLFLAKASTLWVEFTMYRRASHQNQYQFHAHAVAVLTTLQKNALRHHCKSPLPPKCLACNEEGHAAWSTKCPKRPTKPIAGLPNVKIRCTNKSSTELPPQTTQNNRIHEKITTHDYIINKYKHNLNKEENVNREEIIRKLRRRFVQDFSIDTSVVFFGNSMYILMFDLLNPERTSPTEPKDQISQTVTNITQHD